MSGPQAGAGAGGTGAGGTGQRCPGCAQVAAALEGRDPSLIAVLPHAVLVLGPHQAMPGYSVLWSRAHCEELHRLPQADWDGLMGDLRRASAAVEAATACHKLNIISLGNVVRHGHLHLYPRRADDPARLRHPYVHEGRFGDPGDPAQRRHWIQAIREAL